MNLIATVTWTYNPLVGKGAENEPHLWRRINGYLQSRLACSIHIYGQNHNPSEQKGFGEGGMGVRRNGDDRN